MVGVMVFNVRVLEFLLLHSIDYYLNVLFLQALEHERLRKFIPDPLFSFR